MKATNANAGFCIFALISIFYVISKRCIDIRLDKILSVFL